MRAAVSLRCASAPASARRLIHGWASTCSQVSRLAGSTTSSFFIRSLASSLTWRAQAQVPVNGCPATRAGHNVGSV
jgi:hypothetical protein